MIIIRHLTSPCVHARAEADALVIDPEDNLIWLLGLDGLKVRE